MTTLAQKKLAKLFSIAESQYGYFTAKQAEAAGFLSTNTTYHVNTGAWIKEDRGIYRLKHFPHSKYGQMIQFLLWSRDRQEKIQGVYSHESALSLYELSDVNPSKLHMSVPKSFRKSTPIPEILRLYYQDIHAKDIGSVEGVLVTKPLRTLIDLIVTSRTSLEFVEQAFHEALSRGLLIKRDLSSGEVPAEAKKIFDEWLRNHSKTSRGVKHG